MASFHLYYYVYSVTMSTPLSFRRCVSFLLLTWLTEPGVCERRNEEEEPAMEITEEQRKVASLMACVRNYKMQLIMVSFRNERDM